MLYHPKWAETKADPFELSTLIAWLEKQPTEKTYCFMDNGGCLLAQYFTEQGFKEVSMGGTHIVHGPNRGDYQDLPPHMSSIAVGNPRTFGAALKRARSALARTS